MKISIIIPFREQSGEFLKDKLKKIFSGEFKDFEVVVVDDASPFPAKEVLKDFPEVKLIELKDTPPFNMANARNEGAKQAQGELLAFSDTDVMASSDDFEKLINDNFDVVYGLVKYKEEEGLLKHITYFALIRKIFFDKIGGFDERFVGNYGYDDVFLEWKIKRFKGRTKTVNIVVEMVRPDKGTHGFNIAELTRVNAKLFNELTSSYQYIPVPEFLSSYPGYLSDDDIRVLGHFALEAQKGIVEIGSLAGKSANVFLHFSNLPLTCIDPFAGGVGLPILPQFPQGISVSEEAMPYFYEHIVNKFPERVRHIRKPSDEAIAEIEEGSFDLLFIDGDHSYEQVKKDFENYSKKIAKGGIIIFHDYKHPNYPGIEQLVNEIAQQYNLILTTNSIAVFKMNKS